jgi:hypothetical protein
MNAGFSNLTTLKAALLAPALRAAIDFDAQIAVIGQGIAGLFSTYCNRDFGYVAGAQEVASGNREFWFVRRSPVSVFSNVELRYFRADNWTSIANQPLAADESKGLIHFGYTLGRAPIQVRITYNGGYFWEQLEPNDPAYPTAVPADITNNAAGLPPASFNLPPDLLSAWLLQCEITWKMRDKLGAGITQGEAKGRGPLYEINDLDLAPIVQKMLQPYKRYQLT